MLNLQDLYRKIKFSAVVLGFNCSWLVNLTLVYNK